MSNISMVEADLPPGFRFHPRDEELICDYLMKKVTCCEAAANLMIEVDLNKCEPWQIPEMACVGGKEWYFYTHRDRKYSIGLRTNRATASGYWKATGKDRPVFRKGTLVGMRKTLVFYQGRAPKGRKTDWVMHEFRIEGLLPHPKVSSVKGSGALDGCLHSPCPGNMQPSSAPKGPRLSLINEDWVLCRVLYKKRETNQSKANMGSLYYNDMGGSSSLPAVFDSYITFDQIAPPNTHEEHNNNQYQQVPVPCFSNFSQNQTSINYDPNFITSSSSSSNAMEANLILDGCGPYLNPPYVCDKDMLKLVLNHLSNIETTDLKASPGLGDSENYMYL